MIEKGGYEGDWMAVCNGCTFFEELYDTTWQHVIQWFKDNKWKFRKNGKEWEHYCPECQKEGKVPT